MGRQGEEAMSDEEMRLMGKEQTAGEGVRAMTSLIFISVQNKTVKPV